MDLPGSRNYPALVHRHLLVFAALLLAGPADARQRHHYECELERPTSVGQLRGTSRVSEQGERLYVALNWSFSRGPEPISIGTSWSSWHAEQPGRSTAAFFYGRRGQQIRFQFIGDGGEVLLASAPLRRNRHRFFLYPIPWDTLRGLARRARVLRIRAIEGVGILSEESLSSAQLEQVERDAAQLSGDFAAMVAAYRTRCRSTRDDILIVGS